MRKRYIIAFLMPCLLMANTSYAGYNEAVAAYKRGEYWLAFKELFSFLLPKDIIPQDVNNEYQQWKIKIEAMGLPENYEDVVPWLEKKANEGSADAQYYLGVMYRDGLGVMKNPQLAQTWLKKAADQGLGSAQYDLGKMYFSGNSVPKNYGSALNLMQKSANQGNGNAMMYMGKMYGEGLGVSPDVVLAYAWLTLAEGYVGDSTSKKMLGQSRQTLSGQMSPEQVKAAGTIVETLKKNIVTH